jgi:dihydropteroate synthase
MGILNLTPDSFSDGGAYVDVEAAIDHGLKMAEAGAHLVDVGGESTRPGSQPVEATEQIRRVKPVIQELAGRLRAPMSVDTTSAAVAEAALDAGAAIVNDISALRADPRMADLLAERGCPVVIMHMKGTPRTMQTAPRYDDVVREVMGFLRERRDVALNAGLAPERIALDPGFGFGKTRDHNLRLLANMESFLELAQPLLVGFSRKRTIGDVLDLPVEQRLEGSLAAAVAATLAGASIVRVHDVQPTVRAVRMAAAIRAHDDRRPKP